jgi:hypothetical protein
MEKTIENGTQVSETKEIVALGEGAKLADVIAKVNELVSKANAKRDRGPASKREMTEADAREVIFGSLKDLAHGKAAEKLGLSYGQVYSARWGYTYKKVFQEFKKANPNREFAGPTK